MTRWVARLGLPLLAKELIEQAARKRTYVIRAGYATLLFIAALLFFHRTLSVGLSSPLAVLGSGRGMLATLIGLQFAGIYAVMPAITCGVLTQEKERASLPLLFLTRLGPWTILFEKFMSRLIPMLGFLAMSLPLLAFAYSLGGITPRSLCVGVWLLVLATIQTGTLALTCSAFFRSTVGAFIWSYLVLLLMFFGPGIGWIMCWSVTGTSVIDVVNGIGGDQFTWIPLLVFPFFGPMWFFGPSPGAISLWPLAIHTSVMLTASTGCLIVARAALVRRAFLSPRNVVLNVFRILDRIFLRLNNNPLTRGFVFIGDTASLPGDEPVAWRETAKRSLGKAQYLLRVLVAIEIPVAAFCVMVVLAAESADPLGPLLSIVWIVAALMVSAQAGSLIAGERTHQTLDVLCATPLAGSDIVRQKFRSVLRLMIVLLIPFFTIFFFESSIRWRIPSRSYGPNLLVREFDLPLYLTCASVSVAVYLPLFGWLALLIGLKAKTQARAVVASLAAVVGWCVGPLVFVVMPLTIIFPGDGVQDRLFVQFTELLSPVTIVVANEQMFRHEFRDARWTAVFVNFLVYGAALAVIRNQCFKHADRLLGRSETIRLAAKPHDPEITTLPEWKRQSVAAQMDGDGT
jgi:hypothetical protein